MRKRETKRTLNVQQTFGLLSGGHITVWTGCPRPDGLARRYFNTVIHTRGSFQPGT